MAMYSHAITLITGETIPLSALEFSTSRSGGPGGQNVNKVETRVEIRFPITGSQWLAESTQERLAIKLRSKIDTSGAIRVASSIARTQGGNRTAAVERLERLLNSALEPEKPRVATRPTYASKQRRVEIKKKHAEKKSSRRSGWDD
ncbi:MAG: alternative ribosome rescue aminoacyl-tRNA hydrolase ArfB [Candidatus Kapaibacterium sp.]